MLQPLEETSYRIIGTNGSDTSDVTEAELIKYAKKTPLAPDTKILICATQTVVFARDLPLLENLGTMPTNEASKPNQQPLPQSESSVHPSALPATSYIAPQKHFQKSSAAIAFAIFLILSMIAVPRFQQSAAAREAAKQAHEAAKQAVDSVAALVSVTEAGVNYSEYGRRYADAKIVMDRFNATANRNEPVPAKLNEAMNAFEDAKSLWRMKIEADSDTDFMASRGFLNVTKPEVGRIVSKYKMQDEVHEDYISLDFALSNLWSHATISVDEARQKL